MSIDATAIKATAIFSEPDRLYRYVLTRQFVEPEPKKYVAFIMLNPSTADESVGDPTVRRCMQFARDWDYGKMVVLNLFAIRSTDPKVLYSVEDPIGPHNDEAIALYAGKADYVLCAWGEHGKLNDRATAVKRLLQEVNVQPYCFGTNASGQPRHPLYLPRNVGVSRLLM